MPRRVSVESGLVDYEDAWQAPQGSGAATRQLLDLLDQTPPDMVRSLDQNAGIARHALEKMQQDYEWAARWGATRADIQNARRIVGKGPGWVTRLQKALEEGAVLPAVALGLVRRTLQDRSDERPGTPPGGPAPG